MQPNEINQGDKGSFSSYPITFYHIHAHSSTRLFQSILTIVAFHNKVYSTLPSARPLNYLRLSFKSKCSIPCLWTGEFPWGLKDHTYLADSGGNFIHWFRLFLQVFCLKSPDLLGLGFGSVADGIKDCSKFVFHELADYLVLFSSMSRHFLGFSSWITQI